MIVTFEDVVSSNIRSIMTSIDADGTHKEMIITFHTGGTYAYPFPGDETLRAFLHSGSKGKFFHEHFKHLRFRRIPSWSIAVSQE